MAANNVPSSLIDLFHGIQVAIMLALMTSRLFSVLSAIIVQSPPIFFLTNRIAVFPLSCNFAFSFAVFYCQISFNLRGGSARQRRTWMGTGTAMVHATV